MSTNKLLNNLQWKTVGTVSTPDSGYKTLYAKSTDPYLYLVDDGGNEKKLGFSIYPKNGLNITSLGATYVNDYQLDIAIGTGLTFSGDFVGSTLNVMGLTAYSLGDGTFTDGYILGVTSSGDLNWVPYPTVNANGTNNFIAKFTSSSTIGDSLIQDDGSKIYIGTAPSIVTASFSVDTNINVGSIIYFGDTNFKKIDTSSNFLISSNSSDFTIRYDDGSSTLNYIIATYSDNSILLVETLKVVKGTPNYMYMGNTSSATSINFYSNVDGLLNLEGSATSGLLKIADGNQGDYKILKSDSSGYATWINLTANKGITVSNLVISSNISGYGLTISTMNDSLNLDYGIFGSTLTYSTGVVDLPTTGVTSGTYGSSASIPQITVDAYGRITSISGVSVSIGSGNGGIMTPADKNWSSNAVSMNGSTASSSTITYTPLQGSYVSVFVNGQEMEVGNATTSVACYFGTNSTSPKGFSASNAIQAGDYLYWNPTYAKFNLESDFRISLHYLVSP
jgi:hypothetical protein